MRSAEVTRKTNETDIAVKINLDGAGKYKINTGIGFFDHMLSLVAFHGSFDIEITCKGDLNIDCHHTVEDVGLTLGRAFRKALGNDPVISRYGNSVVPMDDSLSQAVVDISGRPYLVFKCEFQNEKAGELETETVKEFFKSFVQESRINLHIENRYGENTHHVIESIFKSFARSLSEASRKAIGGVPSTKGTL